MTNYEERPNNVSKNAIQFAQACVDDNSVEDLEELNTGAWYLVADSDDMTSWDITAEEWHWSVGAAYYAKQNDGSIMDDGRVVV